MSEFAGAVNLDSSKAEAQKVEAHNTQMLNELAARGVDPARVTVAAIQLRLESLIDGVIAPEIRGVFELHYERSISKFLNDLMRATEPAGEDKPEP